MQHLVFMHPKVIIAIRDRRKICESRLSVNAHPANRVESGDELLFKAVGSDVELYAVVERVEHYHNLRPEDISALRELYSASTDDIPGLNVDAYWQSKARSRHATFVWLTDLCILHIPKAELPTSRTGWIADWPR